MIDECDFNISLVNFLVQNCPWIQLLHGITHECWIDLKKLGIIIGKSSYPIGSMVLLYMVTWIPSTKTPFMLALIYQHQPDPSWV